MAHRLAPQARAELSRIWSYIAKESGSVTVADGVVDAIAERFYLLASIPTSAALATTCVPACAAFRSGST
jgi:plasmid stabilization system protein ParE